MDARMFWRSAKALRDNARGVIVPDDDWADELEVLAGYTSHETVHDRCIDMLAEHRGVEPLRTTG